MGGQLHGVESHPHSCQGLKTSRFCRLLDSSWFPLPATSSSVATPSLVGCFSKEAITHTGLVFLCLLADENPEADNGGRKENRKGAPTKKVQGNAQILHQEEKQRGEGEEEEAADEGSCSELPPSPKGFRKGRQNGWWSKTLDIG